MRGLIRTIKYEISELPDPNTVFSDYCKRTGLQTEFEISKHSGFRNFVIIVKSLFLVSYKKKLFRLYLNPLSAIGR